MLWWFLTVASATAIHLAPPDYSPDLVECVTGIAEKYLQSSCLAFLFPYNFSAPSVIDVPLLVRSPLLKNIHNSWAPFLPTTNLNKNHIPFKIPLPLGPISRLQCAHLIVLENSSVPFIAQIDDMIFNSKTGFYENGGGVETKMIITANSPISVQDIQKVLYYFYTMGEVDVVFVDYKNGVHNILAIFPFGADGQSCPEDGVEVVIVDRWVNGNFTRGTNLFPKRVPQKFNNCAMKVSTIRFPPFMILNKEQQPYDGVEFHIVQMIGGHLQLKVEFIARTKLHGTLWVEGETMHGSWIDMRQGVVWMTVGHGVNIIANFHVAYAAVSYMNSQPTWFFQNPEEVPTWKLSYLGFSPLLWALVAATIVIFPFILYVIEKLDGRNKSIESVSWYILVSWSIAVGNSLLLKKNSLTVRFIIYTWLFYTMHVNLAYSAGLTGLITTGKIDPKISTFQQLFDSNLKTAMPLYTRKAQSSVDDPLIKQILSRSVIITDLDSVFSQMKRYRNLSVLDLDILLSYKMNVDKLDIYKSDLGLAQSSYGILMRRNHFMISKIANLTSRVFESGLITKLIKDYTTHWKNPYVPQLRPYSLRDLAGPFYLLILGYILSIIIFIGELTLTYVVETFCNFQILGRY